MLVLWIVIAAVIYFLLLGMVLVFFASVSKMNHHWERAFRQSHPGAEEEHFFRAA